MAALSALPRPCPSPWDVSSALGWCSGGRPKHELRFLSRCFAVGSKDMSTWVFGAERWDNLIYYALGGHKDAIVACFFESSSLDVCPCSRTPSPAVSRVTVVSGVLGPLLRAPWSPGELAVAVRCGAQGQVWGTHGAGTGSCHGCLRSEWARGPGDPTHLLLAFAAVHPQPGRSPVCVAV